VKKTANYETPQQNSLTSVVEHKTRSGYNSPMLSSVVEQPILSIDLAAQGRHCTLKLKQIHIALYGVYFR
jgi:hypothetical protein